MSLQKLTYIEGIKKIFFLIQFNGFTT